MQSLTAPFLSVVNLNSIVAVEKNKGSPIDRLMIAEHSFFAAYFSSRYLDLVSSVSCSWLPRKRCVIVSVVDWVRRSSKKSCEVMIDHSLMIFNLSGLELFSNFSRTAKTNCDIQKAFHWLFSFTFSNYGIIMIVVLSTCILILLVLSFCYCTTMKQSYCRFPSTTFNLSSKSCRSKLSCV